MRELSPSVLARLTSIGSLAASRDQHAAAGDTQRAEFFQQAIDYRFAYIESSEAKVGEWEAFL
ncbi:hypothetical protein [Xanthomonas hortorum]|uniref:hypothetical protein n=1 Tax=Xanthomonas hortorum TaxID=56454 RepID=UPI0032E84ED2